MCSIFGLDVRDAAVHGAGGCAAALIEKRVAATIPTRSRRGRLEERADVPVRRSRECVCRGTRTDGAWRGRPPRRSEAHGGRASMSSRCLEPSLTLGARRRGIGHPALATSATSATSVARDLLGRFDLGGGPRGDVPRRDGVRRGLCERAAGSPRACERRWHRRTFRSSHSISQRIRLCLTVSPKKLCRMCSKNTEDDRPCSTPGRSASLPPHLLVCRHGGVRRLPRPASSESVTGRRGHFSPKILASYGETARRGGMIASSCTRTERTRRSPSRTVRVHRILERKPSRSSVIDELRVVALGVGRSDGLAPNGTAPTTDSSRRGCGTDAHRRVRRERAGWTRTCAASERRWLRGATPPSPHRIVPTCRNVLRVGGE